MRKLLATTLFASLMAFNVAAQEAPAEAPAENAAPAVAAAPATTAQRPQEVVRNVHEDWQIKCSVGENQQCYLSQLILGQDNRGLLEVTLVPAKIESEPDAVMGATIVAPLNILLQRGIYLQVDEKDPTKRDFDWCSQVGCYARFGVTQADIDSYIKANKLSTVIFSIQNPKQGVVIDLSLKGFTAAYNELMEIEAE